MEQRRQVRNPTIVFLLMIALIPVTSSNQNLYTFTTTIGISSTSDDQLADHVLLQSLNDTTSIYRDPTTYTPLSTSIQTEEILEALDTTVLNKYANPPYDRYEENSEENVDPEGPPDHVIPYSAHEEANDAPTRPKYVAPGVWAKPPPDKNIPLDFVPTKMHAQVRGTHTVKRLPQREAIENAETDEEKSNAHRLREVVTNSKVNTIYTEEGYEDSGYDHAGHVRDADFHEGYARKLHDQKNNRHASGKKNEGKYNNLDEFKEYDDDYQDHLEANRKLKEDSDEGNNLIRYGKDIWEGSEIDPKLVVASGTRQLEEDVEKDVEETEKSSRIYQKAQESKLHEDDSIDSSESDETREGDDRRKDEDNKPATTKKKKSKTEKIGASDKETKQLRKLERKKKLYRKNYGTTVIPSENRTSSIDDKARINPSTSQVYVIDQTTLSYVSSSPTVSSQQVDEPMTIKYGHLFWDYFKTKQYPSTTESTVFISNSTVLNSKEQTPIAVATIDGHGPYLLVTREETTTLPSTFLGTHSFHPRNLFSDHVEFGPNSIQGHTYHLPPGQNNVNYVEDINNVIAATTVATFTNVQPLEVQSLLSSQHEDTERTTSETLLDSAESSSTPAIMTINFTQEAYSRIADYQANPFLGPILDNSEIVVDRKPKYKVLVRPKPKNPVKPVVHQQSHQVPSSTVFPEKDKSKQIRDELNAKYNKILDYIRDKQKIQSVPENKKIIYPTDLILMKPPILQQVTYPIFPTSRPPIVNHSSVPMERKSPSDANWRNQLRDHRHSQPASSPIRFDPYSVVQPARLMYPTNLLPATKLLPPSPIANIYTNYRQDRQNNDYLSYIGNKPQQRDNMRYFPLPEASWRMRLRRKRSDKSEFSDFNGALDVKATANNGVSNDGEVEQRDEGLSSRATDKTRGKLSSRGVFEEKPVNVSDITRSRDGERIASTVWSKNSVIVDGESENAEARHEDMRETTIDSSKLVVEEATELVRRKKRDVTQRKRRSRGNPQDRTNKRDHEELLNESPKISGDVIEKEIAARFNGEDDEISARDKDGKKVEVEVPNFDYVEELAEASLVESSTTTEVSIDFKKYPFYKNKNLPSSSALKYVVNPKRIPQKTSHGMEFYDSRNAYKQCDEVEPNVDEALPEKEEPDPERSPRGNLPRLRGLGDKLDCFKAKYFDDDPLDNPLFSEKLIEGPTPPSELDPVKFTSKILLLPEKDDDYVVHRVSKKPERSGRQWRNRNPQFETHESIRVNYKHDPQTGRGRNAYLHTVRGSRPHIAVRRVKNQKSKSKITTTPQSPKLYQTASYQNQVYEDVMGNIRNMAHQIYEVTTLPPVTQILATAGSENTLKVTEVMPNPPKEKNTTLPKDAAINITKKTKSSEIKGLVPPPKYPMRQSNYRKHRPSGKNRIALMRTPSMPRIIAHHTVKINKRSLVKDTTASNFSGNAKSEDEEKAVEKAIQIDGNSTVEKSVEGMMNETNSILETMDLKTEESRSVHVKDRSLPSTALKIDETNDKKNSNFTSGDQKSEASQRTVYTIKDRIRYSKPKWDTRGFGKFNADPKMADEDRRRKEPRYNRIERKKPANDSTVLRYNSTDSASSIESATSSIEGGESSTTEVYRTEESVVQRAIYGKRSRYPQSEETESIVDARSEESTEEQTESMTNTYRVHEDVNEDVPATATELTSPVNSKEILNLQEYLESDLPGYAEATFERTTTPSSKSDANVNHEAEDRDEKKETDYSKKTASSWEDDSSEKAEEQTETSMKTRDDSSEEVSSNEKEDYKDNRTFFTYKKRPSWAESDKNDRSYEKTTSYRPFPFTRYKSMRREKKDENDSEDKGSKEKSTEYTFPWHADREEDKQSKVQDFDRYEYPWERRDRLARERRRKRKQAEKLRKLFFGDDEDEEETRKRERPLYPWEVYDVPSKGHVNNRRDVSPRDTNDSEESSVEKLPFKKFSSRYSSSDVNPSAKESSAREISRSIIKFLEDDLNNESGEETSKEIEDRSPSFARKPSASSGRGLSRGTLVPEDITQPPRRKSGRRRIQPVNKDVSSNLKFDSKKLKSKEVSDEEEKEEEETSTDTTSSQSLFSFTTEAFPSAQRKKRRRKVSKSSSILSLDSTPAESVITEPTRRRRKKAEISTTTSGVPSTSRDLETSKSASAPVRRRYSKMDNVVKTNGSNPLDEIPNTTTERPKETETSTPKTRMIEHRSRVSKEKIVRKTTYPGDNVDSVKETSAPKDTMKEVKIRLARRKKKNKRNNNNDNTNEKSIKRNDEDNDDDLVNDDEIVRPEKFKVRDKDNPLKNFDVKKEEVKKINNFSAFDEVTSNEDDDDADFGSAMVSEAYALGNLLQNVSPSRRNDRAEEKTESESNGASEEWREQISSEETEDEEEEDDDAEERRGSLLQAKFIKDPERRLYYYVERK